MNFVMAPSDTTDVLVAAGILALAHVFVTEMRRVPDRIRDTLLMAGAGVSLTYVLLHILPRLADKQQDLLATTETGLLGFMQNHAYNMALIGMVVMFGVSRMAAKGSSRQTMPALVTTVVAYSAYNVLIGYLIVHRLRVEFFTLILITVAMFTYLFVSDYGLRRKWSEAYDRWVRWVLAVSVLVGGILGVSTDISGNTIALWFSFLAGVMIMDTIREKLPREAPGTFKAFLAGVLGYCLLIVAFRLSA